MKDHRKLRQGEDEGDAKRPETGLRNRIVVIDRVQEVPGGKEEGRNGQRGKANPAEHVGRGHYGEHVGDRITGWERACGQLPDLESARCDKGADAKNDGCEDAEQPKRRRKRDGRTCGMKIRQGKLRLPRFKEHLPQGDDGAHRQKQPRRIFAREKSEKKHRCRKPPESAKPSVARQQQGGSDEFKHKEPRRRE